MVQSCARPYVNPIDLLCGVHVLSEFNLSENSVTHGTALQNKHYAGASLCRSRKLQPSLISRLLEIKPLEHVGMNCGSKEAIFAAETRPGFTSCIFHFRVKNARLSYKSRQD